MKKGDWDSLFYRRCVVKWSFYAFIIEPFHCGNGDKSRCLQLAPTLTESWSKTMVKVLDGMRHTSHGVCDLFCEGLTSPRVITFDLRVITWSVDISLTCHWDLSTDSIETSSLCHWKDLKVRRNSLTLSLGVATNVFEIKDVKCNWAWPSPTTR